MRGEFYLVLRKKGRPIGSLGARVSDKSPRLAPGEVAMKIKMELPETLFQKPTLEAKITIPADRLLPVQINADVAENIADTLKRNLGMDLKVTIEETQ